MRYLMLLITVSMTPLVAQQRKMVGPRATAPESCVSEAYYEAVLHAIRPPQWQVSRISITFGSEFRYVVKVDGTSAELLKGIPDGNILKQLQDLDAAGKLPYDPDEAVGLLAYTWHRKPIPIIKFKQLHIEFMAALENYVSDSQKRFNTVLTEGGVLHLHSPEYSIRYDNHGFEHINVIAWDDTDDPTKTRPLIKWVHEILKLSEEYFGNK
jgi:hypothetical protein